MAAPHPGVVIKAAGFQVSCSGISSGGSGEFAAMFWAVSELRDPQAQALLQAPPVPATVLYLGPCSAPFSVPLLSWGTR